MATLPYIRNEACENGIQSGSDRILQFYDRPNNPGLVSHATSILSGYTQHIIPPDYDLIIDNPVENRGYVIDTLNLLYDLKRPFNLNIFALRAIPNTELANELMRRNVNIDNIKTSYPIAAPTLATCIAYLLTVFRPPKKIFKYLLKYAKPFTEEQPYFPLLFFFPRALWLLKRAYNHVKFFDFSVFQVKLVGSFSILEFLDFLKSSLRPLPRVLSIGGSMNRRPRPAYHVTHSINPFSSNIHRD